MKRFILSKCGLNTLKENIIKESYGDKVEIVKKYLDDNFMRASFEKDGENVGIFVKLNNHLPTEKSLWKQDVLDILDNEFNNIITDKKGRDGFLNQVLNDWYNKKISKYGSLSKYDW
jgi:hypothetical protein